MVVAIDTKKLRYFEKPVAKRDFVQECYPKLRFKRTSQLQKLCKCKKIYWKCTEMSAGFGSVVLANSALLHWSHNSCQVPSLVCCCLDWRRRAVGCLVRGASWKTTNNSFNYIDILLVPIVLRSLSAHKKIVWKTNNIKWYLQSFLCSPFPLFLHQQFCRHGRRFAHYSARSRPAQIPEKGL